MLPPDEIYRLAGWNTPLPFQPIATSTATNTYDSTASHKSNNPNHINTNNNANNNTLQEKGNYSKSNNLDKKTSMESNLLSTRQSDNHTSFVNKVPHTSMSGNPIAPIPMYLSDRIQTHEKKVSSKIIDRLSSLKKEVNLAIDKNFTNIDSNLKDVTDIFKLSVYNINTIDQVLTKLQAESFSELNYYKLKQLNEGL